MQSVSDDDVRKSFLEQRRFELAAKGVFRLGVRRCYIFWQSIPGLRASNWEARLPTVDRLTDGTRSIFTVLEILITKCCFQ